MCNSLALSTLNSRMPERRARSISSGSLPTPEKTTFDADLRLACSTRCSSPPETMSKPAAERGEQAKDRQVGVGLHRVADGVFAGAKRLVELLVSARGWRSPNTRTAEYRSAARARLEGHIVGEEFALGEGRERSFRL